MKKHLPISSVLLLLAGCAAPQLSQTELANADYGRQATATECTSIAEDYIKATLKDPFSAQFVHGRACYKGALKRSLMQGGSWVFGYLQEGTVNAKNSYGGYVGFRSYKALIRDGIVVNYCTVDPADGICM